MMTKKPVLGYVLKGYPRISETFISNEILRLEELGFEIKIFPMRKPRENFCHDSVKQIKAPVYYLPTHLYRNFGQLIVPNLALLVKSPVRYLKTFGLACTRYGRTRKVATFKHLLQAGFMVNNHLLGGDRVDHLHGHFAHSPTSVTMFASKLSGVPFSFTAHAKDIYTSNRDQLKEKIGEAEFVATCTRYNQKYLEGVAGEGTTPLHCVYHGIDLSLFQWKGARVECAPPYKLITIARMTEKKGLPIVYEALAQLKSQGVKFSHILIGDGDDREQILALIKKLQLEKECECQGTQTHKEVLDHFRESDLFVLGCRVAHNGDRDGIPNVLVESLAMGVPAISTAVSAIPELLINEKTGLCIEPENPEKMAEAILRLLEDKDLRQKVMGEGQEFVREHFDNEKLIRDLADLFTRYVTLR